MKAIGGPDFAELFAALPVAVLVVDDSGCIVFANAECETLLNLSERAMLGQPLVSVMTPPPPPPVESMLTTGPKGLVIVSTSGVPVVISSMVPDPPAFGEM